MDSIFTKPFESLNAFSIDSESLILFSSDSFIAILSTTADMSCFLFFSRSGNSSIGYTTPSTLTLT